MKKQISIPQLTPSEIEKFWKKVNKSAPGGCWEWIGYTMPSGYGQVGIRYKLYLVHRVAWAIAIGEDPGEQQVCHGCDNPKCANPAHLFLGTQRDNMADMISKGRDDHTQNVRGDKIGTSKLTEPQVKEIWRLHLTEGLGERKLAARFGVTPANIHIILSGQSWKHLMPDNPSPLVKPKNGRPRKYHERA